MFLFKLRSKLKNKVISASKQANSDLKRACHKLILRTLLVALIFLLSTLTIKSTSPVVLKHLLASLILLFFVSMLLLAICASKKKIFHLKSAKKDLKNHNEALVLKVEEKNQEINKMELDKISQLYRLAEFGKLSAGIFHDLINPLTAISLNLEQINCTENIFLGSAREHLKQAIAASSKMEALISSIRKSICQQKEERLFSPISEIENTLKLLRYQANKEHIQIKLKSENNIAIYGDVLKFNQILSNLILNSIDACKELSTKCRKIIKINVKRGERALIIRVSDNGKGILESDIKKIFKPFFTTKSVDGLGLGLAFTKTLVEKNFKGSITVYSKPNKITIFIIKIPSS